LLVEASDPPHHERLVGEPECHAGELDERGLGNRVVNELGRKPPCGRMPLDLPRGRDQDVDDLQQPARDELTPRGPVWKEEIERRDDRPPAPSSGEQRADAVALVAQVDVNDRVGHLAQGR
jgi:hypothetical protein